MKLGVAYRLAAVVVGAAIGFTIFFGNPFSAEYRTPLGARRGLDSWRIADAQSHRSSTPSLE
jgi:hypothetical protein